MPQKELSQNSAKSPADRNLIELTDEELQGAAIATVVFGGVPPRIKNCWFKGWHPCESELLKMAQAAHPRSIILAGEVGTGKSALFSAMLKTRFCYYAKRNGDVLTKGFMQIFTWRFHWLRFSDFNGLIRPGDGGDFKMEEFDIIRQFQGILIIDDLLDGTVTDWDLAKLSELIDFRYSNDLTLWCTANISGGDLKTWPGFERSYSRLADTDWCDYFEIVGPDRRKNKT